VHDSRITQLLPSDDGAVLYTGCAAAAPKMYEQDVNELPLAVVSVANGSVVRRLGSKFPFNVSHLSIGGGGDEKSSTWLQCISADGGVFRFPTHHKAGTAFEIIITTPLSHTVLSGTPAYAAVTAPRPPSPAALADRPAPGTSAASGPEFISQAGYRGPMDGYLFRPGSKGLGYYRKDVVARDAPLPPPRDPRDQSAVSPGTKNNEDVETAGAAGAAAADTAGTPSPEAVRSYL
jgi:hypothetical protein